MWMLGFRSAFAVTRVVAPMKDNYFMHPPFNEWYRGVVDLIYHLHRADEPSKKITDAINKHPPKTGWDKDSIQFVRLAMKIAEKQL